MLAENSVCNLTTAESNKAKIWPVKIGGDDSVDCFCSCSVWVFCVRSLSVASFLVLQSPC